MLGFTIRRGISLHCIRWTRSMTRDDKCLIANEKALEE